MTHWTKITPETRHFNDESYQKIHTPVEYFWTEKQKEEKEAKKRKEETEKK